MNRTKNISEKEISIINQTDLLIILSILFIPAAYIYVAAVFVVQLSRKKFSIKEILRDKVLFVATFYLMTGIIFSHYKIISLIYGLMIFFCMFTYYTVSKNSLGLCWDKVRKTFFIISVIVFIIGIVQYYNPQFTIPDKWIDFSEYNLNKRIYSTFFNPNIFGFYINIIIIMACENLNFKKFNLESGVFVLGISCLFLTFSRTSWISLVIALFIMGILDKKYIKFAFVILLFIFSTDFIAGIGRSDISKAIGDSSFQYRIEIWKASLNIFKDNVFTGIGFGTLFKYIPDYSDTVKTTVEHTHNLYLQVLTEAGLLGLSCFIYLIVCIIKRIWRNKKNIKNNSSFLTVIAIIVMTLIHGLVDSVFFTPQILMILSIYAGLVKGISP